MTRTDNTTTGVQMAQNRPRHLFLPVCIVGNSRCSGAPSPTRPHFVTYGSPRQHPRNHPARQKIEGVGYPCAAQYSILAHKKHRNFQESGRSKRKGGENSSLVLSLPKLRGCSIYRRCSRNVSQSRHLHLGRALAVWHTLPVHRGPPQPS